MARRIKKEVQKKIVAVEQILHGVYGELACFLIHENPFQLLVATILSAQCTDKKVNKVTPALFERYPDAAAFAEARQEDIENLIHECGFYHAKALHIIGASRMIMEEYGGQVPADMESLTRLPGVGRKTANVVLGDAFQVPGLPVDTHVKRLCNLLGFVKTQDTEKIEQILCQALPPEKWAQFSHQLIMHGRVRCPARRPDCANCELAEYCDHATAQNTEKRLKGS